MKKYLLASILWIALVTASFAWNFISEKAEHNEIALQAARSFFTQVLLTRSWNARHGGVYVPVTPETQPNLALKDPLRDVKTIGGLKLTKINPAYMTRQISEVAARQDGVHFRITSLAPLGSANAPAPLEERALKAFEQGVPELGQVVDDGSNKRFFYMAPLKTEKSCLQCHSGQRYKEGGIQGGISVSMPFAIHPLSLGLTAGHVLIGLAGVLGIIFFGMKLDKSYELIRTQAVTDALTGIPNRRFFLDRLPAEFDRSRRGNYPLSLIMGDIDHFKAYNDTYGHGGGDECLKKVAEAIAQALKRPGDFCARYGGEEFVIVLPCTTQDGARHVAERIRTAVVRLGIPHARAVPAGVVSISLGIATASGAGVSSHEELEAQADKALYRAKAKGRNRSETFEETVCDAAV